MEFTIRRAEDMDAGAIAHVHVESWKSTYAGILPDVFLAALDTKGRTRMWREEITAGSSVVFVAECETNVVGFVSGGKARESIYGYDGELYAIYLLRDYQGYGIGRALVNTFVNSIRERGFSAMMVLVLEKNRAVSFYAQLGGMQIGRKQIEIGGVKLDELILGWKDFDDFIKAE